jgi:hypothetical protein
VTPLADRVECWRMTLWARGDWRLFVAFARVVRGTRNATSWRHNLAPARPSSMAALESHSQYKKPYLCVHLGCRPFHIRHVLGIEVVRLCRALLDNDIHLPHEVVKGYLCNGTLIARYMKLTRCMVAPLHPVADKLLFSRYHGPHM